MEKNDSSKTIIIVLLLIAVLCLGGYTVYDKVLSPKEDAQEENNKDDEKESGNKEVNESKEKELSLQDPVVMKLYGYINSNDRIEREYFNSNDELTRKTVSDDIKLRVAFASNGFGQYRYSSTSEKGNYYTIDANVILNQINEIFGKDNGYNHIKKKIVILGISCLELEYNQANNNYMLHVGSGCGDITNYILYTKLVKATKISDSIVLTEKAYVHANGYGYENNIYKDMKQTKLIASNISLEQAKNEEYFEKGSTVTYTFKLGENGTYYFESSKITY